MSGEKATPFDVLGLISDTIPGNISLKYGFTGPNQTTTTACASGLSAIRGGIEQIILGNTDIAIVGGGDASLNYRDLSGFQRARALSNEGISRPFSNERDGFVMGEGSTMFVLETEESAIKRGLKPLAYILGVGASSDAYHQTAPDPDANGYLDAIQMAIKKAKIEPKDIDVFNSHGTSTPANDSQEVMMYNKLLSHNPFVIALKSQMGHLLGGAGSTELLGSILCVNNGFLPGTLNTQKVGPWKEGEDLADYSNLNLVRETLKETPTKTHLTSNAGFGGHNEALIIQKYE